MTFDPTRYVYHYTRMDRALEGILASDHFRLGNVADTNDPSESRRRNVVSSFAPGGPPLDSWQHLDDFYQIEMQARVGSFCCDAQNAIAGSGSSANGWARDRMWAQYADNHKGVCLCFDRVKLVESFEKALSFRGKCLARPVRYSDVSDLPPLHCDPLPEASLARDQHMRELREQTLDIRYFSKRSDWSGEHEFKLLLLLNAGDSGEKAEFPIFDGALVGIVVGHRLNAVYLPALTKLCLSARIPAAQIEYDNSAFLLPYERELEKFPPPAGWYDG